MESNYSGEITVTSNLFLKLADDGFLKFTGLDMNASAASVFAEEDVSVIKNAFKKTSGGDYSVMLSLRRSDGVFCACLASFHVFFEGCEMLLRIKIADLSELRAAKNELKTLKNVADAYFDILGCVLLKYERKKQLLEIFYINDNRRRVLFKGTLDEWQEDLLSRKVSPENAKEFKELCGDIAAARKNFRHAVKIHGFMGGSDCDECVFSCRFVGGDAGDDTVVGCIEIGGNKMQGLIIDPMNDKDVFLDMLNKRAVIEQANRIMSSPDTKCSYFILLDLDNFKTVNDTYGHIVGDEVLITFTKIINENLDSRGIVGRMGGDEILIVTETIADQTELRNMLRSIRTTVEWTFKNDPRELNVTCSIGVCAFPENGSDFTKLYSLADKMLYIAKSKGKNRYIIYTPELHDSQLEPVGSVPKNVKNFASDKIGIMHRLVDKYLIRHTYNNAKIFSEIGEAFALSEILMIYEDFTVAFQWTPEGIYSDIGKIAHFKPDDTFGSLFNNDNLLVLDGLYKLDGKCPDVEACLEEKGVKSALFYRIDRAGKFSGYVMFAKKMQRQMWSEYEILALSTAAKVFDVSMRV